MNGTQLEAPGDGCTEYSVVTRVLDFEDRDWHRVVAFLRLLAYAKLCTGFWGSLFSLLTERS